MQIDPSKLFGPPPQENPQDLQDPKIAIEKVLKEHPEVAEYFDAESLEELAAEMIEQIKVVLRKVKIQRIEFHADDKMFIDLHTNKIHLGLGAVARRIDIWKEIAHGFSNDDSTQKGQIALMVASSLRCSAAHEAGHQVIDLNPLDVGITKEDWGQFGISSLANCLMDARLDRRNKNLHPEVRADYAISDISMLSENGGYAWFAGSQNGLALEGFDPLFQQFDFEILRYSILNTEQPGISLQTMMAHRDATGLSAEQVRMEFLKQYVHETVDPRVIKALLPFIEDIDEIVHGKKCVPGLDPSKLEVKAKDKRAYRLVGEISRGPYKELLERDKENQGISQTLKIIGLCDINYIHMPPEMVKIVDDKLAEIPDELGEELRSHQDEQADLKAQKDPLEYLSKEVREHLKKHIDIQLGGEKKEEPKEEPAQKGLTPIDILKLLGPAIQCEKLSEPLRKFLLEMWEELEKYIKEQMTKILLDHFGKLFGKPIDNLKDLEDELSKIFAPHTDPQSVPTHANPEEPPPDEPVVPIGGGGGGGEASSWTLPDNLHGIIPRELAEVEAWLEKHVDIQERIEAWREAIHYQLPTGTKLSKTPTTKINGPSIVKDEIRKKMDLMPDREIFLEPERKQQKICLSIMWRTSSAPLREALKLFVYIFKIFQDDYIRKYLDVEILVSQDVPGLQDTDHPSPVPVVLSFEQDAIADYEQILANLKTIQKHSDLNSGIGIVQDATALRTQRERLIRQPSKQRFAIDLWDEKAVERNTPHGAMRAVYDEIDATQEALGGRAFTFIMSGKNPGDKSEVGAHYGPDKYTCTQTTGILISKLDKLVQSMIKFKDEFAEKFQEEIKNKNNE